MTERPEREEPTAGPQSQNLRSELVYAIPRYPIPDLDSPTAKWVLLGRPDGPGRALLVLDGDRLGAYTVGTYEGPGLAFALQQALFEAAAADADPAVVFEHWARQVSQAVAALEQGTGGARRVVERLA